MGKKSICESPSPSNSSSRRCWGAPFDVKCTADMWGDGEVLEMRESAHVQIPSFSRISASSNVIGCRSCSAYIVVENWRCMLGVSVRVVI